MTSVAAAAALLLAVAVACNPASQIDRAAEVDVSGRFLLPDGSPAARVTAVLARGPDLGDLFGGLVPASFTLFTACLADPPPEICRGGFRRAATTSAGGEVAYHLSGRPTQAFFGNANAFVLSARVPDGPSTTARFHIQTEQLRLPDLRRWQADLRFEGADRLRWLAVPTEGYGSGGGYRVLFEDTTGARVWSVEEERGPRLRFDLSILEDAAGTAAVVANRTLEAEGTDVTVLYGSGPVPFTGTAGVPLSRGAPCALGPDPAVAPPSPCPATDGDFGRTLDAPATGVTVDLGSVRPVSLIVARGCTCRLDTSEDGTEWRPFADLRAVDTSTRVPRATSARFARATPRSEGGDLSSLRELSVWDDHPAVAVAGPAGGFSGAGEDAPARLPWIVAACLALGVVAGARVAVAVSGRR